MWYFSCKQLGSDSTCFRQKYITFFLNLRNDKTDIILRKISENSVHFSQFQNTFTQKHYKYRQTLRYFCNRKNLDRGK